MIFGDENQSTKDSLQILIGQITRTRAKKLQETLNGLVKELFGPTKPLKKIPSQIKPLKELEPTRKFKSP